jgi:NADH:ubiquinone oxidoreductase subunit B-like Fe-S oxidoreductase/intein/homing endonuclease
LVAEHEVKKAGPAAARDGPGLSVLVGKVKELIQEAIADPVTYLANWGRSYSLWPVHLETACCSIEWGAVSGPRFDAERYGTLEAFGSLRQCDLVVVHGTVTRKMAPRLRWIYDQMPEPKWVVAMGACLRGDSLVYTPLGPKQLELIQAGEEVFAYDEKKRVVVSAPVVATKFNGERAVYRLRAGSYETVATADHKFAVYSLTTTSKWKEYTTLVKLRELGFTTREIEAMIGVKSRTQAYWLDHPPQQFGYDLTWKKLEDLEEHELVSTFSHDIVGESKEINYRNEGKLRNKSVIPLKTSDDLAWIIGVYMGGGWKVGHSAGFSVPRFDSIREDLKSTLENTFNLAPSDALPLVACSTSIGGMMKTALGLGRDVHSKTILDWFFTLPRSQVDSFIAGLIDSDGHVGLPGFAQVSSANRSMLEYVVELCHFRSIPIRGIFRKEKEYTLEGRQRFSTEYIISFPTSVVSKLPIRKEHLLRTVTRISSRTAGIRTNHSGISVERVKSVVPRGKELVYDIEVAGFHNFFANGQMVHNCSISGGVYFDSYNVLPGVDQVVPVDVYVPGCPPRPEELIDAILLLQDKIRKMGIR